VRLHVHISHDLIRFLYILIILLKMFCDFL